MQFETIRHSPLFKNVAEDSIVAWILEQGGPTALQAGELLFQEGEAAHSFYILLEGKLQISKHIHAQEIVLTLHQDPGSFTGEVPLLTNSPYVASARALVATDLLRYDADTFRKVLAGCPIILQVILSTLTQRVQNMEQVTMQQEKLAALGKLSAGLAHELNNPASAAQRAAGQLREIFLALPTLNRLLYGKNVPPQHLLPLQQMALEQAAQQLELDPLTLSTREDELISWLEAHHIDESWQYASTLVEAGLDKDWFSASTSAIPDEALQDVVVVLEKTLSMLNLLTTVEQSTRRISELVKAIKSYTHMDQAPLQEINLHEGIKDTLLMLQYKLKHLDVTTEFDQKLPRICAYASELNQVWTNLLDNACDALNGKGHIWVRTWRENQDILVEIADDGPGIPAEIQHRIFEPFFTTKGVGQGSGLGLDITYRIIKTRHKGDIQVLSQPGNTRFIVRLPIGK